MFKSLEQEESTFRIRALLHVLVIVALGLSSHDNSGVISRISLVWLSIALLSSIELLHFWYSPLTQVAGFHREWFIALIYMGLLLQFVALISCPLGKQFGHWQDPYLLTRVLPIIYGLALVPAFLIIYGENALSGFAFPLCIIIQTTAGLLLIAAFPYPTIDVFLFQEKAADALINGINPYTIRYSDVYTPELSLHFYPPGWSVNGILQSGYPYMPLILFMSLLGTFLGDCRYSSLIAIIVSSCLIAYTKPGKFSKITALFFLFLPFFPLMLVNAWNESYVVLMLAIAWFCHCRCKRLLPYAVGLLLVSKQYMIIVTPLVLLFLKRRWDFQNIKSFAWRAIFAGSVITLPLVLWDVEEFINSAVSFLLRHPFRFDSISFLALANPDNPVMWTWVPFVCSMAAIISILWCDRYRRVNFPFAAGFTLMLFFAFNKQAFGNYYYLVCGAFCLALLYETENTFGQCAPLHLKQYANFRDEFP